MPRNYQLLKNKLPPPQYISDMGGMRIEEDDEDVPARHRCGAVACCIVAGCIVACLGFDVGLPARHRCGKLHVVHVSLLACQRAGAGRRLHGTHVYIGFYMFVT